MGEVIKVGMADWKTCSGEDAVTTLGLGSCVGIAIRDPATGVGVWRILCFQTARKSETMGTVLSLQIRESKIWSRIL